MSTVTLNLSDFKALASETRLDILKALDGKKLSLNDLTAATNLHKVTPHEHLIKLVEAGFIKRYEREGHKWVYYKLAWKGASLLHPENTRIAILFSATFFSMFIGMIGFVNIAFQRFARPLSTLDADGIKESSVGPDPIFLQITIFFVILFIVLLSISLWRYKKNKISKL